MHDTNLSWLWGALIGVFATMLGTILGWILSKPKTKRIKILQNKPFRLSEEREKISENGTHKLYLYRLTLFMDFVFYNPSDNFRMMRNIRLAFLDSHNKILFSLDVKDLENTTSVFPGFNVPKGIDSINIAPKTGELYRCSVVLYKEEIEQKDLINKISVVFDDENNKIVSNSFMSPDFKNIIIKKSVGGE